MYHRKCSQQPPGYNVHRSSYQAPALDRELGLLQPPSGADPELWQWFCAVDTDRSGTITVLELQSALLNGNMPSYLPMYQVLIPDFQETGQVKSFLGSLWLFTSAQLRI